MTKEIVGSKGGGEKQHKPIEYPNNLKSTASIRIIDLVSEGPIVGLVNGLKSVYLDETPVQNPDGSNNFKNVRVDYRNGYADQDILPGFPAVENELGVGVELTSATPYTHQFTNLNMDALRIRLSTPSLSKTNSDNGDIKGYEVKYAVDVSVDGGPYQEVFQSGFKGKTMSKFERAHRIDLPRATSDWTVRVRRLTANSSDINVQDKTYIESLTEVIDGKFRYPYSALCGIQFDAVQFQNVPSRAYDLKGRIIQVPTNYDPDKRIYTGIWDGTFKLAWTDNPAWIFFDLVTNERYGLGTVLGMENTNKWALYKIARYADGWVPTGKPKRANLTSGVNSLSMNATTRTITRSAGNFLTEGFLVGDSVTIAGFSNTANNQEGVIVAVTATTMQISSDLDFVTQAAAAGRTISLSRPLEPRFTCNLYLQTQAEAFKVIQDLATSFRGMMYWANGEVQAISDMPEDPVYTYSPANVVQGKFVYHGTGRKARHTVALVNWSDQSSFGRSKVEYVGDDDAIAKYGIQQTDMMAIGCTSQSQAHRLGRYLLTTAQYETQTVEFSVGLDGTLVAPGSIIRIADPIRAGSRLGGRVSRVSQQLVQYSTDLTNAIWARSALATVTADATLAPDGLTSAEKVIPDSTGTTHYIEIPLGTFADNEIISASVYVKKADYNCARMEIRTKNGSGPTCGGNIVTGTLLTNTQGTGNTGVVNSITDAGNGWYLLKIENCSVTTGGTAVRLRVTMVNSSNTSAFTGNSVLGTYVWGAQANRGATVNPHLGTGLGAGDFVFLDKMPEPAPAAGDSMTVTLPNGVTETKTILGVSTGYGAIVTAPWSATPQVASMWAVDRVALQTQRYRVLSVTEKTDGSYSITGAEHNASKFSAVDFDTKIVVPNTGGLPGAVAQPASVTILPYTRKGNVYVGQHVYIYWPPVPGAKRYFVEWQRDDDDWVRMEAVPNCSVDIRNAFPGTYRASVVAESSTGMMSEEKLSADVVVTEATEPPGFVAALNASIAAALLTAENAQATADGSIVSFWQASPPVIGTGAGQAKVGDFWFDTDNGNKLYRVVGTAWTDARDDDIGNALAAAATAQSTADGKVKTWFGATAPTAPDVTAVKGIGDLWYDTVAKKLKRWTGLGWTQDIADSTYEALGGSGVNLMYDGYSRFNNVNFPANFPAGSGRSGTVTASAYDSTRSLSGTLGSHKFTILDATGSASLSWAYFGKDNSDYSLPVQGGIDYIASMYVYISTAQQVRLAIKTADGTLRMSSTGATAVPANTWTRITQVIPIPGSFTGLDGILLAYFNVGAVTTSYTVNVDRIMVEEKIGGLSTASNWRQGTPGTSEFDTKLLVVNAQDVADDAAAEAAAALTDLANIALDSKLGAKEKVTVAREWKEVFAEYPIYLARGLETLPVSYTTNYTTDYTALRDYLRTTLGMLDASYVWTNFTGFTDIVRATWDQKWKDYMVSRTTLLNALASPPGTGEDVAVNGSFENNLAAYAGGSGLAVGTNVADNWEVVEGVNVGGWTVSLDTTASRIRSGSRALLLHANNGYALPSGASTYVVIGNTKKFTVQPGERFGIRGMVTEDFTAALAAGINRRIMFGLRYYNAAGAVVSDSVPQYSSTGTRTPGPGTDKTQLFEKAVTVPAGVVYARVACYCLIQNTNGTSHTFGTNLLDVRFDDISVIRWGAGYELTEAGSTRQLGDLRNSPPVGFANVGSAWLTGNITYSAAAGTPATATISFSASSMSVNGVTISYNATSVGVTGTNGGSTSFMVYFDDPTWAGGARTMGATTSYATLINALGRVYIGNVTVNFPSSGAGSGGGDKNCVMVDMPLPDGRMAGDVRQGDLMHLCDPETQQEILGKVTWSETVEAECVEIHAANGVVMRCSTDGPIWTDIGYVDAEYTLGRTVLTKVDGKMVESVIETVINIGTQQVQYITVGDRAFWAGLNGYMLHHNMKQNPGGP